MTLAAHIFMVDIMKSVTHGVILMDVHITLPTLHIVLMTYILFLVYICFNEWALQLTRGLRSIEIRDTVQ